jgi:hypothetical protein
MTPVEHHPSEAEARADVAASSRAQPAPRWWESILNFALVLWVVRVPVATTAFGWLVLGWTSQAQELFVECARVSVWRMLWFLFGLTAVWVLPTHYAARMLIDTDPRICGRGLNAPKFLNGSAKCMPRVLGFLTFMAVEFAIWRNMPRLDEINVLADVDRALIEMALLVAAGAAAYVVWFTKRPRSAVLGDVAAFSRAQPVPRWWDCTLNFALVLWIVRVPVSMTAFGWVLLGWTSQAQDLFVEFAHVSVWWMIWFLFVLTAIWALPTHYAARMLIDTDSRFCGRGFDATRCLKGSAKCMPRLLGFLTFMAVEFAIWRSHANMPNLHEINVLEDVDRALLETALLVAAGAAAYMVWVIKRPRNFVLRGWPGRLNAKLGNFWQTISPRVCGAPDEESRDIGRLVLAGVFVIFLGIFLFGADRAGAIFPRAMAVPFILGGWLPFLSYLSGVGRQIRAPLIAGLIVLIALCAAVLGDNHSVRRIASGNLAPLPLQDAVDLWMTENGCNPKIRQGTVATPCPRPILVAAAGGASRAGFLMASVIGYFLDESARYGLSVKDVRNRIFAISSVSGGSMGAVMVTAALNAAPTGSDNLPCVREPVDQWWGAAVSNWRDCFEALTSGDFLTADFLGFAFNDMLPFAWRDRAAVLEDSWRNRFREVVPAANKDADASSCLGLDCPFLSLRPRPGHWIPLLVLNGTSEATGGRILTTSLATTYTPSLRGPGSCPSAIAPAACPLFVQADSFHQLLKTKVTAERWSDRLGFLEHYLLRDTDGDDVRLSTAAHNSARYPFISPPGSIRNQDQMIVDRIVDGGYFEKYGALAAKELALAVHAVEPQLKPLVIIISNDPADMLDPADDATTDQQGAPRPRAADGELLSEVNAPITTFANVRSAHGVLAVDQLRTTLHAAIPECSKLAIQVRVWPDDDKQLSMSWWESDLVQRQLHRQTEDNREPKPDRGADKNQNRPHLDSIWREMKASSCAEK